MTDRVLDRKRPANAFTDHPLRSTNRRLERPGSQWIEPRRWVALIDRHPAALAEVETTARAEGHPAMAFALDVTDAEALREAVEETVHRSGRVDALVNNAGIFRGGTILDDALGDWREVMAVNLEAVYLGSKFVAPHMAAQGGGRIVNIASIAGMASRGGVGSYNASKGGVIALTKSLAVELAPFGVAANAIAPGFVRTAQMMSGGVDLTQTSDFTGPYVHRRRIPMARAGVPEDVAGAAVFLASDYCRYTTGQVLVVDGGLTSTF